MQSVLLVFLGGGLGAALRHGVNLGCFRLFGGGFPVATLCVNVVGSFFMGLIVAWLSLRSEQDYSAPLRLFLATGILGGFTTFSAFSMDSVLLWQRGEQSLAGVYIGASVLLSIGSLLAGIALARALS
jgi:fluoride exporter